MRHRIPGGRQWAGRFFVVASALILVEGGAAPVTAQQRTDFKVGLAALVNTALPQGVQALGPQDHRHRLH